MLKIEITDPHLMDKQTLLKTAKFLFEISGNEIIEAPKAKKMPFEMGETVGSGVVNLPMPTAAIAPPPPPPPTFVKQTESLNSNPFAKQAEPVNTLAWEDVPTDQPLAAIDRIINATEVDVKGLPWDARIHSRGASKNGDGTWRYKRGVHEAEITRIETELRQALHAPIIPETYEAPVLRGTPPQAPVDPIAPVENDFPAFMQKITAAVGSGQLQQAKLIQIVKEFGLPSVAVVGSRLDLIPKIMERIDIEMRSN